MAMKLYIKSISDIYTIQFIYDQYSEIIIDFSALKYLGVGRYALKYALWALKKDGIITILDTHQDTRSSRSRITFNQVRLEVFKALGDDVEVIDVDDRERFVKVKKISDRYTNIGFSFGIIFSGSLNEEGQLIRAVESILGNKDLKKYPYEIVICGPSDFFSESFILQFGEANIRYLAYNTISMPRFMISQKKNYLYSAMKYNIVSISHTRIVYPDNFVNEVFYKKFDLFTTKVLVNQNGHRFKYMDFSLIDTYDITKYPIRGIPSGDIKDEVLYYMQKRVPYIDGGLTIFNKNILADPPYNNKIAWGEAEDVDMCANIYFKGLLIDYFTFLESESLTCKIGIKNSARHKLKRYVMNYLIKKGFI